MPKSGTKASISDVVAAFSSLDEASKRAALAKLKRLMPSDSLTVDKFVENLRDKRFRKGFACPHCSRDMVIRHGSRGGRQRYKCNSCSKTFSGQTHTPFRGTRYPEEWFPFMEHMVNGLSVRKSAKILPKSRVVLLP